MPLRIVFCGTPAFAAPSLRHLIAQPDFEIVSVVTQPDRPRGRGNQISVSPVKAIAIEAGIPVYQPEKIKSPESLDYFKRLAPDVVVIIAYGQIISARLIEIPRLGWINLHASLLPKYRGAAPINWAILNDEKITGLTTMQIDAGLDTGPMLLQYETPIGPDETAPELTTRLAEAGAPLIAETLRSLDQGEITSQSTRQFRSHIRAAIEKRTMALSNGNCLRQIFTIASAACNRGRAPSPRFAARIAISGAGRYLWPTLPRRSDLFPSEWSSQTDERSFLRSE